MLLTIAQIHGNAGKATDPHSLLSPEFHTAPGTLITNTPIKLQPIRQDRLSELRNSSIRLEWHINQQLWWKADPAISRWSLHTSELRAVQAGEGVFCQQQERALHLALESIQVS